MQLLQALILGVIQGLTEFIPVSSSGHLILAGHFLHFQYSGLGFDVALNIGTLTALGVFFFNDFKELAVSLVIKNDKKARLAWMLVLATVPAVLLGILLQEQVETVFRSDTGVAINLIVVALVMLAADRLGRRRRQLDQMTPTRSLGIGLAQAVAVIPGVSRSGITISAGLLEGFDAEAATKLSFLLSAPVILVATLKVLAELTNLQQISAEPLLFGIGVIGSAVSGYLAIKFMLNYLSRHGLALFAYYRIIVGGLILVIGLSR